MVSKGASGATEIEAEATLCAASLAGRIADELARLAADLSAVQTALSPILRAASLSSSELRSLQDLDRATQTLDNLHSAAAALGRTHPNAVPVADLDAALTLRDLRDRLAAPLDEAPSPSLGSTSDGRPASGDIAWL